MKVRFAKKHDGLNLYVVAESDADRMALQEFFGGAGQTHPTLAAISAGWGDHYARGYDHSLPRDIGPEHIQFVVAQVKTVVTTGGQ